MNIDKDEEIVQVLILVLLEDGLGGLTQNPQNSQNSTRTCILVKRRFAFPKILRFLRENNSPPLFYWKMVSESLEKIGMMAYDTEAEHCFELDHNAYVDGTEYITPLFNAIQYQAVQKIHYKPFDEEEKELVFHSQFLKQYNNRWYIFGMEQEHPDEVWNLALDRIVSIKPTKLPYIKLDMDWQDYFSDIIGVTNYKDAPVEEVHFVVHGKTAHYIYSKPIHESQIPHWKEDGSLDVKLKVKINYELKRLLLSYAADITILSPQSLVEAHKTSLQKALEQYR